MPEFNCGSCGAHFGSFAEFEVHFHTLARELPAPLPLDAPLGTEED